MCSNLIKASVLTLALGILGTSLAQAAELTSQERSVCASLQTCLDIVGRHDASEFDYTVLEDEFQRFGPKGQASLLRLLKSDSGHADIARLIAALGPLTTEHRQKLQSSWSTNKAKAYLPLLLDGHPMSRDLLLQSLGDPDADVREQARIALFVLPESVKSTPLSENLSDSLLSALKADPIGAAAPYLSRLNAAGKEDEFATLLRSADPSIVSAAYSALYRNSPSRAFNSLLAEMERIDRPEQSRAIGQMLASRHASRPDGFYLKFATDMSGDAKLSIPARASGLHSLMLIKTDSFPELTPERSEAFSYLIKGQPFVAQDVYLPYLKDAEAAKAMGLIWNSAASGNWINRDQIAEYYSDHRDYDQIIANLLQSPDSRSFRTGLSLSKPKHNSLITARMNDPVTAISKAARQKLGRPMGQNAQSMCHIKAFDLEDMRAQMPFFEGGWMMTPNNARVSLSRSFLTTAHPTRTGWLAGYDIHGPRTTHSGGALLQYDNISGDFQTIGDFSGPVAILPNRPLQLGETTSQFWVIDVRGGDSMDVSVYTLDLSGDTPVIKHIAVLPYGDEDYSVAENGDLLVAFSDEEQPPIRVQKSGSVRLACSQQPPSNISPALQ